MLLVVVICVVDSVLGWLSILICPVVDWVGIFWGVGWVGLVLTVCVSLVSSSRLVCFCCFSCLVWGLSLLTVVQVAVWFVYCCGGGVWRLLMLYGVLGSVQRSVVS